MKTFNLFPKTLPLAPSCNWTALASRDIFIMENEIWKDVVGFEGYYMVSSLGRVKRMEMRIKIGNRNVLFNGKIMGVLDNGKGYDRVKLTKNDKSKRFMLHRLIAEAFIDNNNNHKTVNHIDGNKKNNTISNLEWCTHSDNCKHAWDIKLRVFTDKMRETATKWCNDPSNRDNNGRLKSKK